MKALTNEPAIVTSWSSKRPGSGTEAQPSKKPAGPRGQNRDGAPSSWGERCRRRCYGGQSEQPRCRAAQHVAQDEARKQAGPECNEGHREARQGKASEEETSRHEG